MYRRTFAISLATALTATLLLAGASPALGAGPKAKVRANAKHERIVSFWTAQRMGNATPRDFVKSKRGGLRPAARKNNPKKPRGGGGDSGGSSTGASWTDGGPALTGTGKVFFMMDGTKFTCSGAVVDDGTRSAYSMVMTAGHCAYDETNGKHATKWMFFPEYDTNPTPDCAKATHGCWTAAGLVVHKGYADAGAFNRQATRHDWAFAIIGPSGGQQLDAKVADFPIAFDAKAQTMYSFGYPAAGKYNGNDLVYCAGGVSNDKKNGRATWGMRCDMTPGSSGGPWMKAFDTTTKSGTLNSLNSYKYVGRQGWMYGPKFNSNTDATYLAALSANSNTIAS